MATITTRSLDLIADSSRPVTHTMTVEDGRLARTAEVPGELAALLAPPNGPPELITHQQQRTSRWRLAAPTR